MLKRKNKMAIKFNIPEKYELILLNDWVNNNTYSKVPKKLKEKMDDQQAANLLSHYADLGNFQKEIDDRIKELETKFQKEKEQSFFYLAKRAFKEHLAKTIAWIFLGLVMGFLWNKLF